MKGAVFSTVGNTPVTEILHSRDYHDKPATALPFRLSSFCL
jgi:hypothetical protein